MNAMLLDMTTNGMLLDFNISTNKFKKIGSINISLQSDLSSWDVNECLDENATPILIRLIVLGRK